LQAQRDSKLNEIGNLVPGDKGVPISKDEEKDNAIVYTWGELKSNDDGKYMKHHELLWKVGGFEPQRGTAVAGHRGYYLTGAGVLLNEALKSYGIYFLRDKGYCPVIPPYFMNKEVSVHTHSCSCIKPSSLSTYCEIYLLL
jgi:seryl-tRNA synthetase